MVNTCEYCNTEFESDQCTEWRICPKCLDKECERKQAEILDTCFNSKAYNSFYAFRNKLKVVDNSRQLLSSKAEVELLVARALVKLEADVLNTAREDERVAKRARV